MVMVVVRRVVGPVVVVLVLGRVPILPVMVLVFCLVAILTMVMFVLGRMPIFPVVVLMLGRVAVVLVMVLMVAGVLIRGGFGALLLGRRSATEDKRQCANEETDLQDSVHSAGFSRLRPSASRVRADGVPAVYPGDV